MRVPSSERTSSSAGRVLQGMGLAIVAAYLLGVVTADPLRRATGMQPRSSDIDLVTEAYGLIQQHYVDKAAIKPQEMAYSAIRTMLDSLGDRGHTQFLTNDERQFQQASLAGRFGGIGAEIALQGDRPV